LRNAVLISEVQLDGNDQFGTEEFDIHFIDVLFIDVLLAEVSVKGPSQNSLDAKKTCFI
jgi:hypothetical protein